MFELYKKIIHLQFLGYENPLISAIQMMPDYKHKEPIPEEQIEKKKEYMKHYHQEHYKLKGPKGTEILCLETQEVFESVSKAGEILNCNPSLIFRALKDNNGYYKKKHFVRLDGKDPEEILKDAAEHPEKYLSRSELRKGAKK